MGYAADRSGRAAGAARAGPAARRGASCRLCSNGTDPRRTSAADGGPAGGSADCRDLRSWSCAFLMIVMDTSGAGSWGPLGCISGGFAPLTPSGNPRRDTPPAQGGIWILGKAEVWLVVDVPVTVHYKFQQSSPIFSGRYLRFRSSAECWLLQLLHRDRAYSANCSDSLRFHSAVLGWSSTCPLVCIRQGFGQTVEKTVVPQLLSSDNG